ncbi:MAG: non-ribosomal peptide synthase [Nostoc sp. TH1S01]|nr:non-ribosomal peptide synthase [Nostoc sp. TH1S01]
MNTSEILETLTQKGVKIWIENEKLNIRSPKGVLTPDIQAELTAHKLEILEFLRDTSQQEHATRNNIYSTSAIPLPQGLILQTIGRLIGGASEQLSLECQEPVIDPRLMAQRLSITFRPLPKKYKNVEIIKFRAKLEQKLQEYGVKVIPWQQATREFRYEINIPFTNIKKSIKTRVVKTGINAVIDVDRPASIRSLAETFAAEKLYQLYSHFILKGRKISVTRIGSLIGWAEDCAAKFIEDPTNTQVIVLSNIDKEFVSFQTPYQEKIKMGLNTLVRTFSEIVIGVSQSEFSILNMNLSDSVFSMDEFDKFVLKSLIPKVYVPILPLPLSKFKLGSYNPQSSIYAQKLVSLSTQLADTNLFPPGSKLSEVIKRQSHRDIVNVIVNGRTGVSYGFVAYAEPPQYIGAIEIPEHEWESLTAVNGFSSDEVRQNTIGRRYLKTKVGVEYKFKQIPDIWVCSARSGSNKTNLQLENDILRIGLTDRLLLDLPQGVDPKLADIKPSYDVYVMLAIALSTSLYAPNLITNGMPMIHFHGYPAVEWLQEQEYFMGVNNPSVPCGTYESGVFNFLSIYNLVNQYGTDINLACLIEPDHGTNIIAPDLEYLLSRLKTGCEQSAIELGGKHFYSLEKTK